MKKTLLTLLMVFIQIGNCNTVDNKLSVSQSSAEAPYHQGISQGTESNKSQHTNESSREVDQSDRGSDEAQGSIVGKVAKVFGFTLLGLVGACAALAVYVVSMGGIGGC
jgi:hypothetical protein